jgi:hypothetical protein
MSRRSLLSLLSLLLLFLSLDPLTHADSELRVNETATKVLFQKQPAEVLLAVENRTGKTLNTRVEVQLLTASDETKAKSSQLQTIATGKEILDLPLHFSFADLNASERRQLLWYRLHYRILAVESNSTLAQGFISISEIAADLFELHLITSDVAREGGRYRARVRASHPVSRRPAAGIPLEAELRLEENQGQSLKLRTVKTTDSRGHAVLEFELPKRFPTYPHQDLHSGGELKVTARRGGVVAEVDHDVLVDQFPKILISTDKRLYQPGQVMHVRAIVLSPGKHALPNQDVVFKISDPEHTGVYRVVAKTSRFGVASADWSIADNVRLGDYQVEVGIDEHSANSYRVRISRYELPNFTVSVEPDRKYYLPGQNAEVKVRADYLFGQPVTKGQVRVVRETDREWNYREQKWDIDEGEEHVGQTDANGLFVARINLAEHHEDTDSAYKDLTYAAYFTDQTTNRTEQRRFDLRVTREAIHIYVMRPDYNSEINNQMPLEFYISTFYADGTPARCVVRSKVTDGLEDPKFNKTLPTLRTNRYGLGRITGISMPRGLEKYDEVTLVISATDSRGRKGSKDQEFFVDDDHLVRIEADKALYTTGEPITAVITSTLRDDTINVDLVREATVIRSERVKLHNGRASLTFPYRSDLKDSLTLAAYPDLPDSLSEVGTDAVLYPRDSELKVNLRMSQDSYRPGEEAHVDLSVRAPKGSSPESALGLVVFDKAVEERFRTEQEFGQQTSHFYDSLQTFLGFDEQIAGVTLRDLKNLDMSKAISPDLELLADLLLKGSGRYFPMLHSADHYDRNLMTYFRWPTQKQVAPITTALTNRYQRTTEHPNSPESLKLLLRESSIDLDSYRDPWGIQYRPHFYFERDNDVFELTSAGPDKRFDTDDDFVVTSLRWKYFRPIGEQIDKALKHHHERTGGFIRDLDTLHEESLKQGLNLGQLRDRWGRPYRFAFTIRESNYLITVNSSGPNKQFAPKPHSYDDFVIWTASIDYFAEKRAQLQTELARYSETTKRFPQTDEELRKALSGEDLGALKDPWGHPYYRTFKTQHDYADRVRIMNRATAGARPSEHIEVTPVTRMTGFVSLRSVGPDGVGGTIDDFSVATLSAILSEEQRNQVKPQEIPPGVVVAPARGIVFGAVTDSAGASIPNASVVLKLPVENAEFVTKTNEDGKYVFSNLKVGLYHLSVEAQGFKLSLVEGIWVSSGNLTEVNTSLEPGAVTETVTVTAEAGGLVLLSSSNSQSVSTRRFSVVTRSGVAMETPRLREYFPETLLWQPSIETDKQGRAKVNFKLADNITTWKVAVVASTEDGLVATSEKEIKAFQPFFVEHEPPRVLTEGDEISLPVVVRNYLEREQKVDLQIKPESWFSLLGPAQKRSVVVAGDAKRETFDFRAISSIEDGKQRITAIGADADDAIEKPVSVHPDGEEVSVTDGIIVADSGALEIVLPENSIPRSSRAELKIYPNLFAHVIESIEAIMSRPYGCAEQTISSTYPSLLLLRHQKLSGEEVAMRPRARRYLTDGYSRLLNYRNADGSFGYWGHGNADVALTAYALRFLTDASDLIDVDASVVRDARAWLIRQQQADGRWRALAYSGEAENPRRSALLTAYIARMLATTGAKLSDDQKPDEILSVQKRTLDYLSRLAGQIDEPYFLASLALALIDWQDTQSAAPIVDKLRSLAHAEGKQIYWSLETNTPFYGWGLAGRVETTALVLQALNRYCNSNGVECGSEVNLVEPGLLFLLKQKDRYGVWYSTQTTINVLDALLTLLSTQGSSTDSMSQIVVNGHAVSTIQMPGGNRLVSPITVDLTRFVRAGRNTIEIKRPSGSAFASAQARLNYYVPWPKAPALNHVEGEVTNDLRLTTKFDKIEAGINDTITVHVEAERVGFRGYGMMLAEIGLPPGADVDRSSLETAMKGSGWGINQYDVLPDRVVLYLWPQAGGVKFDFKFRPRFGLNAKAAPSLLYDYYNPEARVTLAPERFVVRETR